MIVPFDEITEFTDCTETAESRCLIERIGQNILMRILYNNRQPYGLKTGCIIDVVAHECCFCQRDSMLLDDLAQRGEFVLASLNGADFELVRPRRYDCIRLCGDDEHLDPQSSEFL